MISNEQIAHDLTMVYLRNRYGIEMSGSFASGDGSISSAHFPSVSDPRYIKVGTGEQGFFGREKQKLVRSGNKVDALFSIMVQDYLDAYAYFYRLLCERNSDSGA